MGFFNTIGSGIKSVYNYMRPTKSSHDNFTDAQQSATTALTEIKDAGANTVQGAWDTVKIAKDGFIGVKAFDFIAGKIVTTKAVNDLAWFAVPTMTAQVVNVAFNTLVKFPGYIMLGTIALTVATNPEAVIEAVKHFGSAALDTTKAGYHTAKSAFELTKAGVALGYEVADDILASVDDMFSLDIDLSGLTNSDITMSDLEYANAS